MALTETVQYAQDIRGEFCSINEITDTIILRDGEEITSSRHRSGGKAAGSLVDNVYVRTDITVFSQAYQNIASALWTDDLHTRLEAHLREQ